ncbi:MAG TPA: CYTH domain-containing protein [Longimicrobiales bacterium]|nr:CYTH domain-containing protein [Longimicrobiales bacterium]
MTETETKVELSAESFERLLATATLLGVIDQLNVYYDCADAISKRSGSLRIRFVKDAAPVMTLKLSIERRAGRRVSTEIEDLFARRLPPRQLNVEELSSLFQPHLRRICDTPLRRLGAMRTRRNVVRLSSGEVIELDRVTLPGGQLFHEAEIESDDPAVHETALAALRAAVPDWRYSDRGKFQRFREAMRNL